MNQPVDNLPTNLPLQLSSFIGRTQEREEVSRLLASSCLLTLTGAGGCGKTRLALQVATDLLDTYKDGVFLVELATLPEERLVPQQIASALGLGEQRGQTWIETLTHYLREKAMLLLLDNCEHLLDACASVVESLLHACPDLTILATSREALRAPGEQIWRVPSLLHPNLEQLPTEEQDVPSALLQYDACLLFMERATGHRSDFGLTRHNSPAVARICHHLDGIPLAIELAATQVRVMTPEQIETHLHDRFPLLRSGERTAPTRQQTLRATLDWSYDLLGEEERRLLERLSVFAGGWTLQAAEAVCADAEGEVLELLSSLVDKSLIVYEEREGESRYRLLETMRQYAAGRLLEAGQAATYRTKHRDYFHPLVKDVKPKLSGPEQAHWLHQLEKEHDNLRAVLDFCLKESARTEDSIVGIQLTAELPLYWEMSGRCVEGRDYLELALTHPTLEPLTSEHALVLEGAGILAFRQGDFDRANVHHRACLKIRQNLNDTLGTIHSLRHLGNVEEDIGDYDRARALYTEALRLSQDTGEPELEGAILCDLGSVLWMQGDYNLARNYTKAGLLLARRQGNQRGIAFALYNLGHIASLQGDYEAAHAYQAESLTLWQERASKRGIVFSLEDLAEQALRQGGMERAARLYAAASWLREKIGEPVPLARQQEYERNLAAVQDALGEEACSAIWSNQHTVSIEQSIAYALERPS